MTFAMNQHKGIMANPLPSPIHDDRFAVRRPVLIPLFGTLLCLLIAFVLFSQWLDKASERSFLQQETENIAQQLQHAMEAQALSFKQQMLLLSQSDALRHAYRAGDREGLLRYSQPILANLQESRVTHMSFHRPDRVNFLRVHKPELHGDRIDRPVLRQAEQSGRFAFGTEIGRTGTLSLRAVLPWWDGPILIGYLELGKEVEAFISALQVPFGHTLYTFLARSRLEGSPLRGLAPLSENRSDGQSFAELVFVGPAATPYPEGLRSYLASNLWKADTPLATLSPALDASHNHFFALPIRDSTAEVAGRLVVMTTPSPHQIALREYLLALLWGAGALVLLLGLFLNRLLQRVENTVVQTSQALRSHHENLMESQALLHNTLESLEDGILVIDGQTVRHANARFAALWQIPVPSTTAVEPLLAQMGARLATPAPFLAHVREATATRQPQQGVVHCLDGHVLEYHAFPVPCPQGKCLQVWVFHDSTRRARMEQREAHALQSRIAISALLETGLAPLSLEDQLHTALEIILAVPWLSLEYKGSIFLLEEAGEQLVMAAQRGLSPHLLSQCAQVAMGYCLCGRAARTREILFAPHIDTHHETRYPDMQPHGHYCVPILHRERLLGVLNLYVPDGYAHNPEEEAFLTTLSYTLANLIERRAIEQHLLEERAFSTSLLATAPALVVVLDPEGQVMLFNQACQRLSGYGEGELLGRSVVELLVPPTEREAMQPLWQQLLHEQTPNLPAIPYEGHWQAKNGELFLISWSYNVIHHKDGTLRSIIATGVDITAQRRTEKMLQHVAGHDVLTGLPNRALFQVRLSEHLSMAKRSRGEVVLLFLDLDRFKQVNDTLGHKAGDELLREATRRILSCVRPYDLVARLGGDEFTIILPQLTHLYYVEFIARRILEELAKPFQLEAGEANVSGSIGITLFPRDATEMETLLKHADTAMYSAKSAGRNAFCFFTAEMQLAAMARMQMEEGLRAALNNQEFELHYQPKLELASQKILGMEALLRWRKPDGAGGETWVSPGDFIPLAEESGLIVPLGNWVLHTACRQNKQWQEEGLPPMRVAVNLSASQFRRPDALIEAVTLALQESQLDPDHLELEITESMVMSDEAQAIQTMKLFQEMRIKISVDDFGTGYSSLGSLKKFPIHALKIDRAFIHDLTPTPSDATAIVQAILSLAKQLHLRVVAEGVENHAQQAFLLEHACDEMQGFFFSRPLTAKDFARFVREKSAP
ncbi:MAG: EAL domain-containing protein [Magnetococcales bacterium]|nr:EAL domain-containing protein [Magnetococcales bacterium]